MFLARLLANDALHLCHSQWICPEWWIQLAKIYFAGLVGGVAGAVPALAGIVMSKGFRPFGALGSMAAMSVR
jgi:hypothetical protein